ncbi:DUF692 domain-containing protein [Curvibacter sp. APW13]|uniref:MNIO family bufferin maturase n=1 Tax=Curvibacter sp. APW13 TaxID=3077236 RepID=UPI0028DE3510|nr:DUF692 domain-containing protein [Curvibacter sp. APW13]MDT8990406.1 DUF692 domain-containing protein [Curvibacter sp. APW13]
MPAATPHVGIGWRHPHYRELLERQPALDFVEVHSENFFAEGGAALAVLEQGRARYPVSLHGVGLSLGSVAGVDPWHLDRLAQLVERVDPVRVSDHASFARAPWGGSVVHAADLLPIPFTDAALDVLCANVQQVQQRLGRTLLVENLSAYLQWKTPQGQSAWSEPAFLNALVRRSGCGLLVDVNNIYVNACNAARLGDGANPLQACTEWLDAIDPAAVGEIHLAGHCHVVEAEGEIFIDDHGSRVATPVWQLYAHAVHRFGPVATLIEWDTDVPALDVLLDEAALARRIQHDAWREAA